MKEIATSERMKCERTTKNRARECLGYNGELVTYVQCGMPWQCNSIWFFSFFTFKRILTSSTGELVVADCHFWNWIKSKKYGYRRDRVWRARKKWNRNMKYIHSPVRWWQREIQSSNFETFIRWTKSIQRQMQFTAERGERLYHKQKCKMGKSIALSSISSIGWERSGRNAQKCNMNSNSRKDSRVHFDCRSIVGSAKWRRRAHRVQSIFSRPHVLHDLNLNCFSLRMNVCPFVLSETIFYWKDIRCPLRCCCYTFLRAHERCSMSNSAQVVSWSRWDSFLFHFETRKRRKTIFAHFCQSPYTNGSLGATAHHFRSRTRVYARPKETPVIRLNTFYSRHFVVVALIANSVIFQM